MRRQRILREDGVKHLDSLIFDDDPLVRRAAVQAFCNLFESEQARTRQLRCSALSVADCHLVRH